MSMVIPLASRSAAPSLPATGAPTDPHQAFADAHNALSMAAYYLRQPAANVPGATRKAAQDHDSTTWRRRGSAGSEAEGINGMKSAFGARRPGLDESWLATRQPGFGKALAI